MRTRKQIEREVKRSRHIDNDIYDLRPDVIIELLLDIRNAVVKNEKSEQ